jgi:hypothetical protein
MKMFIKRLSADIRPPEHAPGISEKSAYSHRR